MARQPDLHGVSVRSAAFGRIPDLSRSGQTWLDLGGPITISPSDLRAMGMFPGRCGQSVASYATPRRHAKKIRHQGSPRHRTIPQGETINAC